MEKLEFNSTINANPEVVWDILWGKDSYDQWTSVFAEGSTVKTDWKEGSKILFVDGKGSGMVSYIDAKKPYEFMSFRHMGTVKEGVEDFDSPATKEWAGSKENYWLKEVNGKTELKVDIDVTSEYRDYFEKTWPAAMQRIKELAENVSQPAAI